jgi:predicted RNA binding protein YcfA (HicA-like mRNA interferase family)
LKTITGKEFCKLLERNGWTFLRTRGSYHIYKKLGDSMNIAVPVHGNDDIKIGLLRAMLRTVGLTEKDM